MNINYIKLNNKIKYIYIFRLKKGPGESGKSTIFKQMKIINQNGYSHEELEAYKSTIFQNVLDCFFTLIEHSMNMNNPFTLEKNQVN